MIRTSRKTDRQNVEGKETLTDRGIFSHTNDGRTQTDIQTN